VNKHSLFIRPEAFAEDYLPSYISEREWHIKWLMSTLFPAVRGRRPANVWAHGKPGTGKTLVCRFVLHKLRERWGEAVKGAYVNCGRYASLYSILDAIIKEFRLLGGEAPSTSIKLERFMDFVKQKPFIIILDEIDFPAPKERNNILYNLSRTGSVGIVCISRTEETYDRLDERVRSRLSSRTLCFQDYAAEQVLTILHERAAQGLKSGTWNDDLLKAIADLSQGDVRIALETLKSAAEYAETEADKIGIQHVHRGSKDAKVLQKEYALKKLTEHHRIIYRIIEDKSGILSGNLWSCYLETCRTTSLTPIARRTFSSYLQSLESLNLIMSEKASLKGKVRIFRLSP